MLKLKCIWRYCSNLKEIVHNERVFMSSNRSKGIKMSFKTRSESIEVKTVIEEEGGEEPERRKRKTLLDLARTKDIDIEGACGGNIACSTCHVIFDKHSYKNIVNKQPISEEENDMLEMAFHLTPYSRLACQIYVHKELDAAIITVPYDTRNIKF